MPRHLLVTEGMAYASGSYAGDDVDPRTIDTGLGDIMQLTVVMVNSSNNDTVVAHAFKGCTEAVYFNSNETVPNPKQMSLRQQVPDISAADGTFVVTSGGGTGASLNRLGKNYEWSAIGLL